MNCRAPGCRKPVIRRTGHELCEAHYMRLRRNGHLHLVDTNLHGDWTRKVDTYGYIKIKLPKDHPAREVLAPRGTTTARFVFEHRYVGWTMWADQDLQCRWCMVPLTWATLQVDHLNHDKSDNRPENLVQSCNACNMGRGAGANHENWSTSIAVRRLMREHADEFRAHKADVLRLLEGTHNPPVKNKTQAQAIRYAAQRMAEELAA